MTLALPTRRSEEWKYSDLARALGDAGFGEDSGRAMVASVPSDVEIFDLDNRERPIWVERHFGKLSQNVVSAVSLAKARGGLALRVPKNKVVTAPLALDLAGQGHVRMLVVLEEGAHLTLLERADANDARNAGVEIVLGDGARLDHVRLAPSSSAVQVEEVAIVL